MEMDVIDTGFLSWQRQFSDWDYHISKIRGNESLCERDKSAIIKGYEGLRQVLGRDWLHKCFECRHPFLHALVNQAEWNLWWYSDLGRMLAGLSSCPGFDKVFVRLKLPAEYISALAELELGWKIRKIGHAVEFSPLVDGKRPDIRTRIADRDLFLEVAVMRTPQSARRANETLMRLTQPFLESGKVRISGRIHRILSGPHLEELESRIAELARKAIEEDMCIEFAEPGVIHYFIAPWERQGEVSAWQQRHGIRGIEGPPIESSEILRVRRMLKEKCRQLPQWQPGMVVISPGMPMVPFGDPAVYVQIADSLEETVCDNSDLIAGVLVNRVLGPQEAGVFNVPGKPDHTLIKTSYHRVLHATYLVISNRYSRHQFTDLDMAIFLSDELPP